MRVLDFASDPAFVFGDKGSMTASTETSLPDSPSPGSIVKTVALAGIIYGAFRNRTLLYVSVVVFVLSLVLGI